MDIGTPLIEARLSEDEAVEGYRMWFLIPVEDRRLLAPVVVDMHHPWNPDGPSVANCVIPESDRLPGPHDAPVSECRCGLYAMGELNAVVRGGAMDWEERLRCAVLGKARLWGRTMAGPNGWRAEFARVTELLSLPDQEETVREVASAYGVPVKMVPEPVRFEDGPLEGIIRFGTPTVDSFIATFHDYSFVPDHDWETGPEGGMIDEGLKDVTYGLESGVFGCRSLRPRPGSGFVIEDEGWGKVVDEVIRRDRTCAFGSRPARFVAARPHYRLARLVELLRPAGYRTRSAGPC